MADFELVLDTLARIRRACRPRFSGDPDGSGRVSAHQGRVLGFLDAEDPAMVGELAEHLGVTPSTMSLTLSRMEAAGLVRRERDPLDRRVTNVRLTDAGLRAREAGRELDPHRLTRMLDLLLPAERAEALRALTLLGSAADALLRRERADVDRQL